MPGVKSPALWGTVNRLEQLFAAGGTIRAEQRQFTFRYRSPEHWLDVFRTWYGPLHKAFAALPESGQSALKRDILALIGRFNHSGDGGVVLPGDYLEVVVTRR